LIKSGPSLCLKFKIKYGCEGLEEWNNFLHRNFPRFEIDFELQFGKSRSVLGFRKLNKIDRDRLKIYKFAWR
jgi:hypothetical protein